MARDPFGTKRTAVLDPAMVTREVRRFLDEDIGSGDVSTARSVPTGAKATGRIVAREACVVAGIKIARAVFVALDARVSVTPVVADGQAVTAGAVLATLEGPAAPILTGERVALNLLQRLSAIATITRRYVDAIAGTGASVSDTRKTTPGLRAFEKYAVQAGGGRNHRIGLFDAILIKDNHIAVAGGVAQALRAAKAAVGHLVKVEIEVDTLAQLDEVLAEGADVVLLDNMGPDLLRQAVAKIAGRMRTEASGGINLDTVQAIAKTGVDMISVGALTHSASVLDLGLDIMIETRG